MIKERKLSKEQAEKISQVTSSVFAQGDCWVMKEWDLTRGAERLTRGLSQKSAKKRLKNWRKEKIEELLREEKDCPAYILRYWQKNPNWDDQGIWQFFQIHWYTTKEDADKILEKLASEDKLDQKQKYEVYETTTANVPGHFVVA